MRKNIIIAAVCIFVVVVIAVMLFYRPFADTVWQLIGGQSTATADGVQGAGGGGQGAETAGEGQYPASEKKQIIVYTLDKELKIIIEQYAKMHPEFNYKIVYRENDSDFFYDLNHGLQNGEGDKVDMYCVPATYAQWYIKGGYADYASTYKELGINVEAALKKADIPQNIIEAGTNPDGELIALPYKKNVNLFMYRRSIARKVWGTDDPDKIAEVIGAGTGKWDKFLEAAEKLKEHNSYILADYRELSGLVETSIPSDLFSNGNHDINPVWEEYMDISKHLLDNGHIKGSLSWSEEWFKDLEGKTGKPVFGLFIEDNNIKNLSDWLKGTVGDWTVCLPPISVDTGFYTGFNDMDYYTGIMANKNSPNKDALGPLIEWITLDHTQTGLQHGLANGTFYSNASADTYSQYGGKRSVVSGTILKNTDNFIPLLNGQNLNKVVYDALQIPTGKHNATDIGLFSYWYYETEAYLRGEKDRKTAVADYMAIKYSNSEGQHEKHGFSADGRLHPLVGTRELNLYSYDMEIMYLVEQYIQRHPEFNYKVNWYHAALIDDYCTLSLINNNMQGDSGEVVDIYCVPDVYSHEMIKGEYSKHACTYKELGIDVDAALKKADIPQHIIDAGTSPDGELIALPYMTGANIFMYRRSVARDVWGTDNPDEIAKIIGAGTDKWESFLEAAKTLKEHGCYIVPSLRDISVMVDTGEMFDSDRIYNNGFSTFTSGTDISYSIDPKWEEFMDVSKHMLDNGYMSDMRYWSEEWAAALNGKGDKPVFGLVMPYEYIGALSNADYYLAGTAGDWAICVPPFKTRTAFYTGIMVNKNSPNKDSIGPLIKWLTLECSEKGLQHSLVNGTLFDEKSELYQFHGGKRAVISGALLKNTDCTVDFLGGQNINPVICDAINKPTGECANQGYQMSIFNSWLEETNAYANGEKDKEAAIADFTEQVEETKKWYIEIFKGYDISFLLP